ncbi:MAG: hypothetical protein V3R84_10130 [Acidimicrobiia bacterium]
MDILLPRTDGGVLAQLIALVAMSGLAIFALRRRPPERLVAIGLSLVAFGLIGVRALH